MKTIAPNIHATRYQQIKAIMDAIAQGNLLEAKTLVESAIRTLPATATTPDEIQALFFLNAIRHRLNHDATETGNLYLMPDEGQQIRMFNFMAEKFPLVRFSQDQVNAAHLAEIKDQAEVVLLDIGIGSGQQMVRLLNRMHELPSLPKQITLIGIEPAPNSLATAETALRREAESLGIPFQFIGFAKTLESLTPQDWQALDDAIANRSGKFLINAAFALHHITPIQFRSELFTRLYKHRPSLFAMIEPYADFLTTDLLQRFDHAWHHYGLTFSAIDQIDATVEEKNMVKTVFFSREIQDILGEENQRIEQFETGEMWFQRLMNAGFQPYPLPKLQSGIPGCPFVTIQAENGHIRFNVDNHPLVSIITGYSREAASPANL